MHSSFINALRRETPGCEHVLHFNNAGAALITTPVLNAIKEYLDLESRIGCYEAEKEQSYQIEKFYALVSRLINAKPEEIAYMDSATRAWDMLFYSFPFKSGDKIVTCLSEYGSNYLAMLHRAKSLGLEIIHINNDDSGQVDIKDLENKLDGNVKLIAITHVPTQGGLINPAEKIGAIAKKYQIPFLLDTTQSVGQMPIDVEAIGCDFLCATGRKFLRGPRGTGFLYVKKSFLETLHPVMIDIQGAHWIKDKEYILREDAKRFELWEQNYANKIGLSTAIEYSLNIGLSAQWERIQYLATLLRESLKNIPGITLQDKGQNQCGIVTFTAKKHSVEDIQKFLYKNKMNISISVESYARLDLAKRNLPSLARASVHYYNTEEEISLFCDTVGQYIQ